MRQSIQQNDSILAVAAVVTATCWLAKVNVKNHMEHTDAKLKSSLQHFPINVIWKSKPIEQLVFFSCGCTNSLSLFCLQI